MPRQLARRAKRAVAASSSAAAIIWLAALPAHAGTKTYIAGAGTGNWSTNANWSPSGQPQFLDNVNLTPADALNRTVVYDLGNGSILNTYGSVLLHSTGTGSITLRQPGGTFDVQSLTIGTNGLYDCAATAFTFIAGGTISGGTMTTTAPGAMFTATDFTQTGGTIQNGTFTFDHSYTLSGGSINNALIASNGTFNFTGGRAGGGVTRNNGTFIYGSSAGSFAMTFENSGTIIFNTNLATFGALNNKATLTIPAGLTLFNLSTAEAVANSAGTVTQFGSIHAALGAGTFVVRGGVWDQRGGLNRSLITVVGSGAGNAGTYLIGAGSVLTLVTRVGSSGAGTILQSGGLFNGLGTMEIGVAGNGYYGLSGGTLLSSGLVMGGSLSAGAAFVQTAGLAQFGAMSMQSNSNGVVAAVTVSGGRFEITSPATPATNNVAITQTGGAMYFNRIDGTGSIVAGGSGSLTCTSLRQNALSLSGSARVFVSTTPAPPNNRLKTLTFDETGGTLRGTFDIGEVPLILDYEPAASPLANVRRFLRSGFASGQWNGVGLRSSAAMIDPTRRTGLGYAEASALFSTAIGTFAGEMIDNSSVVLRYTPYGDANIDGQVNAQDFTALAGNFNKTNQSWINGDFNYDGTVNALDFNALATNFGQTLTAPPVDAPALGSLAPEPSGVAMLTVLAGIPGRRRSQRRSE